MESDDSNSQGLQLVLLITDDFKLNSSMSFLESQKYMAKSVSCEIHYWDSFPVFQLQAAWRTFRPQMR